MELLFSIVLGVVTTAGVFLVLQARTFSIVLGFAFLSYAANLFIFSMGRLTGEPAIVGLSDNPTDPVPQALVLTAIVISFAMTAFVVALALRGVGEWTSDHVDGKHLEEEEAG